MDETPLSELSDSILVARAKGGDTGAFGQLYQRYVENIYRYLFVRMGDKKDAEDLAEEVFFRSFQSLGRYRERGWPFSAFLYRVAHNMLIDYYRSQKMNVPLSASEPKPDSLRPLDDHVIQDEELKTLRVAIDDLPSNYREVIILRVILSLPTAIVAKWMDQTEVSTRVLLHRALEMLRGRVREQNEKQI
jgi:RNA polymerase sigma-70 factor (ECF subfamily)